MSNPYERILGTRPKRPTPQPSRDVRPSQSSVLSRVAKKKALEKPVIRFQVRPRYRFDLPDPPMHPKMMLTSLSTSSYSKPVISEMELNFKPSAIPADPTYGLNANLVDYDAYSQKAKLLPSDETLLSTILMERPGYSGARPMDINRRITTGASAFPPPPPRRPDTATVPWMRRMSYDEYQGGNRTLTRAQREDKEEKRISGRMAKARKISPAMLKERRRRMLLQTFNTASKIPVHPDPRKSGLRPSMIIPVFLDFRQLGEKFVLMESDKDEKIETNGLDNSPEDQDESERSTVALVVGEGDGKKNIACYKPSKKTMELRKRKRTQEDAASTDGKESKKIKFVDEEIYQKTVEYSARVGEFGKPQPGRSITRSSYAFNMHVNKDSTNRVVTMSKLAAGWKLIKRPSTLPALGADCIAVKRREGYHKEKVHKLVKGRTQNAVVEIKDEK